MSVPTEPTFVRKRPNPFLQFFLKVPPKVYRGPIAKFLSSRCVLRLTTTGRTSGQPRTIAVSYMPLDNGNYVIFSGYGIESQWYQNVRANPNVTIQIADKKRDAVAGVVMDPARRKELMLRMRDRSSSCGPPSFVRRVLRLTRAFDYDAEIQLAVDHAEELPVVELTPTGSTTK
jgi:deazaflavin-dependent oxidoreductase (nitroreductase family)